MYSRIAQWESSSCRQSLGIGREVERLIVEIRIVEFTAGSLNHLIILLIITNNSGPSCHLDIADIYGTLGILLAGQVSLRPIKKITLRG